MSYTLQQFRDLVRATLDLGVADLTDSLVDSWIREGLERAQGRREWPFYETSWSFTTAVDDENYTFAAVAAAHPSGYEVEEIRSIRAQKWPLKPMPLEEMDRRSPLSSAREGTPTHWTTFSTNVFLYPRPTAVETLQARGIRKPADFVTAGDPAGTHDLPKEFDSVILNWAIGRAYAHQDEPQSAVYYADLSEVTLSDLEKRYDDAPIPDGTLMGGGIRNADWLGTPRFPFE